MPVDRTVRVGDPPQALDVVRTVHDAADIVDDNAEEFSGGEWEKLHQSIFGETIKLLLRLQNRMPAMRVCRSPRSTATRPPLDRLPNRTPSSHPAA